ncbi:MAG: hypothetical protein U1D30_23680 [Planctomycetota bacterium]
MSVAATSLDVSLPARELVELAFRALEECDSPAEATYVIRSLHELAIDEKQLAMALAALNKPRAVETHEREVRVSA